MDESHEWPCQPYRTEAAKSGRRCGAMPWEAPLVGRHPGMNGQTVACAWNECDARDGLGAQPQPLGLREDVVHTEYEKYQLRTDIGDP